MNVSVFRGNECTYNPGLVYEINVQKGIYKVWLLHMVPTMKRFSAAKVKVSVR
jgi:hypothetical protein